MITLKKRLGIICVLFSLVFSYFIPVAAMAEVSTVFDIASAKIITENENSHYLDLEVNVNNQTAEKQEKIIGLGTNYLSLTDPTKEEGYSYHVDSQGITLQIEPHIRQSIRLSLKIDEKSYTNKANELLVDDKKIPITPLTQGEEATKTTTSDANSAPSSSTESATTETTATDSQETNHSPAVKPFSLPTLAANGAPLRVNQTIHADYTTDAQGTYPTASWQPAGNTDVLNHQGNRNASDQWDGVKTWDGDPTNKTNSYIEYGGTGNEADYAVRKFAEETTTPGLFDVYLNVRGNVQKETTPLDIALVVDWSGSMNNNNRIGEVSDGVNRFVDTLSNSGITDKISMGYIGYSSDGYNNGSVPMGPFDSVKDQVKSVTPSSTSGGTFTQKALRDAGTMLSTPNGHKKVIVLLTDGVPTYSYKNQKVFTESDGSYYGTEFSKNEEGSGSTSRISKTYNVDDQNGNRKTINSTFIATIGEAMALKQRGIEIHGLGIQLQSDTQANLSKAQVEAKMRQMVSSDQNGTLYYESADHASDISDYLAKKAVQISGTVVNGAVTDPIAQLFVYQPNTLSVKSVGSKQLTVTPSIQMDGTTIKSNQIYLGKDQEIQIHYQVRIQTESKNFKPDYWYQINGTTTFQPLSDSSEIAEFGIPSAKAPGVKLNFTKQWEEFDHDKSSRPDHVTYEVKRTQTIDPNSWQTGFVQLNKPASDTGDTWTRNDVTQLSETSGAGYQENLFLPKYNNQGKDFTYQAIAELDVPGYTSDMLNNTTWKNIKQFTPLNLKVIKQSSSGEQPLEGAVFQLKGGTLDVTLKDNHDGTYSLPDNARLDKGETYTLTELKAPQGHELSQKQTWTINVSDEGKVTIDNKDTSIKDNTITLTVTNQFKKIPIGIRKYTIQEGKQVNLAKATFDLQKKTSTGNYQTIATKETDAAGLALFSASDPGEYRIVETKGPEGYDTIPGNYMFTIDKYGEIHYDGNNVETADQWTLTHENHLKPFDLTVHKKEDNGKALPGAKFRLQGKGVDIELPKDGQPTDTFLFENLQPGTYILTETYTPEGYQGLKQSVKVVIQEDGTVMIDGTAVKNVLVDGEQHNQISLDVTNQAKVPLPETGGSGRLGIYLIGLIALGLSGVYLFMRNHGKGVMK